MHLYEIANDVTTKQDFINFVGLLLKDLKENPNSWENKSLENFLEALQSWTEDMDGYYEYNKIDLPDNIPWKIFTDILMGAKIYE